MDAKFDLRQHMRHLRRGLDARDRHRLGAIIARRLVHTGVFRRGRHLACYLAVDGEVDTHPLIEAAERLGKRIYLPVLLGNHPSAHLGFRLFRRGSRMKRNRFGILEPDGREGGIRHPSSLDLVLAPLVAFDPSGNRLGMGGGYYDRTFAFLHKRLSWQQPRVIGVAYSFQETPRLPAEPWDVPLWGVITEKGLRRFT